MWIKWPNMVKHCLRDEARTKSCEWSFTNMQCFICSFKTTVSNLTWAHQSFGTEAAEVVTFTVQPPNLPKFTRATGTLAAHTVSASATGWGFWVGAAAALLAGFIFALGALASRAQSARIAQAHAALQGSIAVVTGRAGGHWRLLTVTFTSKVHSDLKAVFKAHWLHDEGPTLFFGTAVKFRFNVKWNLWESKIRNCSMALAMLRWWVRFPENAWTEKTYGLQCQLLLIKASVKCKYSQTKIYSDTLNISHIITVFLQ